MKTEQFQNLSLKEANELLDTVSQLVAIAEKLFCIVRGIVVISKGYRFAP